MSNQTIPPGIASRLGSQSSAREAHGVQAPPGGDSAQALASRSDRLLLEISRAIERANEGIAHILQVLQAGVSAPTAPGGAWTQLAPQSVPVPGGALGAHGVQGHLVEIDRLILIIKMVARHFGVTKEIITGLSRKEELVTARHVAVFIACSRTTLSQGRIAGIFNRNPSMISTINRGMLNRFTTEPRFHQEVLLLDEQIAIALGDQVDLDPMREARPSGERGSVRRSSPQP